MSDSSLPAKPLISVNGALCPHVSALERGLAYGDGLFETMLFHKGSLPYLPEHWDRLALGVNRLRLPLDWLELNKWFKQFFKTTASQHSDGIVKVVVTRGDQGRGYKPAAEAKCTYIFAFFPSASQAMIVESIDVVSCAHRLPNNPALAGIKHLNRLDYVLASLEWDSSSSQDALLLDHSGCVVESLSRNVFALIDGELLTPSLKDAGVEGVMRRLIMENYGRALGKPVIEAPLSIETLFAAEEVFLCNSVTGLWALRSIDGVKITRGDATEQLQRMIRDDLPRRSAESATFLESLA